jgi:hypothetical protein
MAKKGRTPEEQSVDPAAIQMLSIGWNGLQKDRFLVCALKV